MSAPPVTYLSAEKALRAAIIALLEATDGHRHRTNGVYDTEAPNGANEPYTVVGEVTEVPWLAHDSEGWAYTVTVHDWVLARDNDLLHELRAVRDTLLHWQTLTLADFNTIRVRREFAEILQEGRPENLRRHQVTRYRTEAWP